MDAGQRYGDQPMLKLGELTLLGVLAAAMAAWRLSSLLPRATVGTTRWTIIITDDITSCYYIIVHNST